MTSRHSLTANSVYSHLIRRNFALLDDPSDPLDLIRYYNPYYEPQPGEDEYSEGGSVSYFDGLRKAITQWGLDKMRMRPGPLWLILLDHGTPDRFYLTGTQYVSSSESDEWLEELELAVTSEGILSQPIIIVLGTCYSGSFINNLSGPQHPNRVIVTSTAPNEASYRGPMEPGGVRDGEFFVSALFNELGRGLDLTGTGPGMVAD